MILLKELMSELHKNNRFFVHLRAEEKKDLILFSFSFRMDQYILKAVKRGKKYLFSEDIDFSERTGENELNSNKYIIEQRNLKEMDLIQVLSSATNIYSKVAIDSAVRHYREMYNANLVTKKEAVLEAVGNLNIKFSNLQIDFNGRDFKYDNKNKDSIILLLTSKKGVIVKNNEKYETPSILFNKVDVFSSINVFLKEVVYAEKLLRLNIDSDKNNTNNKDENRFDKQDNL